MSNNVSCVWFAVFATFHCDIPFFIGGSSIVLLFLFVGTGSGPYVVIDNRSNEASNAREPSSNDDGKCPFSFSLLCLFCIRLSLLSITCNFVS